MTRRIPVWLVGLWWLAVGAVMGLACSESVDNTERTGAQEADAQSSWNTDNSEDMPKTAVYSDEEVGVDDLVDSYLADRRPLVGYRTVEEHDDATYAELESFRFLPVEQRDRVHFEMNVSMLFQAVKLSRPEEIEQAEETLFDAFYDSLDLCVENSEYPDIELYREEDGDYFTVRSTEAVEEAAQRHGITVDEFLDFRHECHKFAASYPSLDREYRDELLRTRRDYYLEFLRLWMRDHPEMVVPLDYENSVNQPYQDYVRQQCMETEDPEACARGEGVSYP